MVFMFFTQPMVSGSKDLRTVNEFYRRINKDVTFIFITNHTDKIELIFVIYLFHVYKVTFLSGCIVGNGI